MKLLKLGHGTLLVALAAVSQVSLAGAVEGKSVWTIIHGMRTVSYEEGAIEEFFGARIDQRSDNGYWTFHEGKGPSLGDGVTISKFGFMTKNDASAAPRVYMDISGKCVNLDDVRKAYPDLFTDQPVPSAHSPLVKYVSRGEGWELGFAFRVDGPRPPYCLVNVGFISKKQGE